MKFCLRFSKGIFENDASYEDLNSDAKFAAAEITKCLTVYNFGFSGVEADLVISMKPQNFQLKDIGINSASYIYRHATSPPPYFDLARFVTNIISSVTQNDIERETEGAKCLRYLDSISNGLYSKPFDMGRKTIFRRADKLIRFTMGVIEVNNFSEHQEKALRDLRNCLKLPSYGLGLSSLMRVHHQRA